VLETKINAILLLLTIVLILGVVILSTLHIMAMDIKALMEGQKITLKCFKDDMKDHQEWLFHQLHALGPGKILKPEEKAEDIEYEPATIRKPYTDEMSEFNGRRSDHY
jgi:hypothetical protein